MTRSIISNPSPLSNVKFIFSLGGLISVLSKTVKKFIFALYDRGWEVLKKCYTGRSRPKVQPLSLLYTFLDRKGTPFVFVYFLSNSTPFIHVPSKELWSSFDFCKGAVFKIWINHKTKTFSSLSSVPKALKRYPFLAEPLRIGLYKITPGLYADQFETSTSPRENPGHLTITCARGVGNLTIVSVGWGIWTESVKFNFFGRSGCSLDARRCDLFHSEMEEFKGKETIMHYAFINGYM